MKPGTKKQAAIYRLDRSEVYKHWRDDKLSHASIDASEILVEIEDISAPNPTESAEILKHCCHNNMALYRCNSACDKEQVVRNKAHAFAHHFGLHRVEQHRSMTPDGLVSIEIIDNSTEGRAGFIPYTDKPISWHTDGYYNPTTSRIKAMILHCVRSAPEGGINELFDPELAYIALRDENPDYINALSHRRTLTIPAFAEKDGTTRAQSVGPVFTWDRYTGNLHMRFTDRKRYIEWCKDDITAEAVGFLRHVLANDDHVLKYKMNAGEGIICNNVLHNRSAFEDNNKPAAGRLLMRARYLDRIEGTCD
ncbi:MAG: TauD/TfdA family dioxygenase [bacterium]|nr:TauD/TfdA family dioxygenase [bacterium]